MLGDENFFNNDFPRFLSILFASYSILFSIQKLSGTIKYLIKGAINDWRSIKQKSIIDLIWTRPWRWFRYTYTCRKYLTVKHTQDERTIHTIYIDNVDCEYVDAPNLILSHLSDKVRVGIILSRETSPETNVVLWRIYIYSTSVSYSLFSANFVASDLRLAGDLSDHEYYNKGSIMKWILYDVYNFRY